MVDHDNRGIVEGSNPVKLQFTGPCKITIHLCTSFFAKRKTKMSKKNNKSLLQLSLE